MLKSGKTIEVVKTLKVNGENAQISYNKNLDIWTVCSKNVGLVAKSKVDLAKYSKNDRHSFSWEIGWVWFDIFDQLS